MEKIEKNQGFSHEEGLKTIYAMIKLTKGSIGANYLYYLLWGYLVALACILEYLFIRVVHSEHSYLVWPVIMGAGLVASAIFTWRQQRTRTHMTFIGNIMGYLWGGWLFSFLILLLFANLRHDYSLIMPVTMVMYGLGIFVSGGVISFKPFIIGGILAWIASVAAYFQPHDVQLLIMIATVILSYIIPGYQLRNAGKMEKS
jgi:hypothetical protein